MAKNRKQRRKITKYVVTGAYTVFTFLAIGFAAADLQMSLLFFGMSVPFFIVLMWIFVQEDREKKARDTWVRVPTESAQ